MTIQHDHFHLLRITTYGQDSRIPNGPRFGEKHIIRQIRKNDIPITLQEYTQALRAGANNVLTTVLTLREVETSMGRNPPREGDPYRTIVVEQLIHQQVSRAIPNQSEQKGSH